jgi:crotonobetainyl-CoA:carnitine CoA-transferase CaiB-like acyl-CoA transferase
MSEDARSVSGPLFPAEKPGVPLAGVRVLDFTHVLAGPFCTRLLADLGADVLHVGTRTRTDQMGATRSDSTSPGSQDRAVFSFNTNRSKRSIAINLKTKGGRSLAVQLASVADVVVENFSCGVMARLELDYERLKPLNPRLIYTSMSGYGHDGPRRDWTSMNMNLQGHSGMTMVTGSEGEAPVGISNSWNDYIAGLHACFGILHALTERITTGVGVHLDLSQFECSVAALGSLLFATIVNRTVPPRLGNRSTSASPQGVYQCSDVDEWCAICVQDDVQWRALVTAMGDPPFGSDVRFETLDGRLRYQEELDLHIEAWTKGLPNTEVESRLKSVGVPAERMRRIHEVLNAPDGARAFCPLKDARGVSRLVTGIPFEFSLSSLAPLQRAPEPGEHTRKALEEWLGLTENEFETLEDQGVLV